MVKDIHQNDWKTLNSKIAYQTKYFKIFENDVIRPNGLRAPYYVLARGNMSIIIPLAADGQTYLVGQHRYTVNFYSWEFPMGSVLDKTQLAVAKQELEEETGFKAQVWEEIGHFYTAPGIARQTAYVYIAKQLIPGPNRREPGEIMKMQKVSISKIYQMISNGKIMDGPTICAFHLLQVYLKKQNNL